MNAQKPLKNTSQIKKVNIQLFEPHNHHVNAAKPAIKTANYYIIAGLSTTNKSFPLKLWDKFVPQIYDTLNMLQTSCENISILAFE